MEIRSPNTLKEVQQLTERIAAISKLLARSAESTPIFLPFEEASRLQMDRAIRESLPRLEKNLGRSLMLSKPRDGEPLYIYLLVTEKTISSVLIRKEQK